MPSNDQYEPNDDFGTATEFETADGTEDLQILNGDVDVFAVDVERGNQLTANISFDHESGNLQLAVYNTTQDRVGLSRSTTDNEDVRVERTSQAGTYYVAVDGKDDATAAYSLSITRKEKNDIYEPNDDLASATELEPNVSLDTLQLMGSDRDFYAIELTAGTSLDTQIEFDHRQENLDLRLYNSSTTMIAANASTTDDERITTHVLDTGRYYVEVFSNGTNSAQYSLNITSTPMGSTTDLRNISLGETRSGEIDIRDPTGQHGHYEPVTIEGQAGQVIQLEARPIPENIVLNLQLQAPNGTIVDVSWNETQNATTVMEHTLQRSGEYVLLVSSGDRRSLAEYELATQILRTEQAINLTVSNDLEIKPGQSTNITYTLQNRFIDADTGSVEIVTASDGTINIPENKTLLGSDETPIPNRGNSLDLPYELIADSNASPGEYTIEARAELSNNTGRTANATRTATVTISTNSTFPAAADTNTNDRIDQSEVVDLIVAYNSGTKIAGKTVSRSDVVSVIIAYNSESES
jgi:hypothetical protein